MCLIFSQAGLGLDMVAEELLAVAEVNERLPLVRCIVRDIVRLHADIEARRRRFESMPGRGEPRADVESTTASAYDEEVRQQQEELVRDCERLSEYSKELQQVGGILGHAESGSVDFPFELDGEKVWLCWRPGDVSVSYWHAGVCGESERVPLCDAIEGVSR